MTENNSKASDFSWENVSFPSGRMMLITNDDIELYGYYDSEKNEFKVDNIGDSEPVNIFGILYN